MHFSFEKVPIKESWYLTYHRQDRGDELVFYPSSTTNPFLLPYQMPYSAFLLNKPVKRETETSNEQSKASSPVRQFGESSKKGDKRKSKSQLIFILSIFQLQLSIQFLIARARTAVRMYEEDEVEDRVNLTRSSQLTCLKAITVFLPDVTHPPSLWVLEVSRTLTIWRRRICSRTREI